MRLLCRLLQTHRHLLKNVPDKKLLPPLRKPDFNKKPPHEPLLLKKNKETKESKKKIFSKLKNKWRPNAKPKDSKRNKNMPKSNSKEQLKPPPTLKENSDSKERSKNSASKNKRDSEFTNKSNQSNLDNRN